MVIIYHLFIKCWLKRTQGLFNIWSEERRVEQTFLVLCSHGQKKEVFFALFLCYNDYRKVGSFDEKQKMG